MSYKRENVAYKEGSDILPSNLRKEQVESYAGDVAKAFGFGIGDDPFQLIPRIGGRISLQQLSEWFGDDRTGSIYVHRQFDFDILLPAYTSPLRDRFTICHELGHYFLHSRQGDVPIVAFRQGTGRIEWEANWFAAALLMPAEEFKKQCALNADTLYLASVFGVSREAAEIRKKICVPQS